jgi:NDP-sugar pyrophosphorylase family protein
MKALILTAGKGTRLGALTTAMPKPMLPINGEPLLAHTVAWLRSHGVTQIAMNLHHAPEVIPAYFGDGRAFGVSIRYSHEETLMGTAGAARRLADFLDERFLVIYGDVFSNVNLTELEEFHAERLRNASPDHAQASGPAATLALYRVTNPTECGLVDADIQGRVRRFIEKPPAHLAFTDLANTGILICEPETLTLVPADRPYDFSHELFPAMLAQRLPLFARPIASNEFVIDIGTAAAYQRAQGQYATALRESLASLEGIPA